MKVARRPQIWAAATSTDEPLVRLSRVAASAVLVVEFRLRLVRGRRAHALFRAESLLNTPLFVGFPGFCSKLWLAHDSRDAYIRSGWVRVHRVSSWPGTGVLAVRPDGYAGFRSARVDAHLGHWLGLVTTSETHRPAT